MQNLLNEAETYIIKEWRSPARKAISQFLVGAILTALIAGSAAIIEYTSTQKVDLRALLSTAGVAIVTSLAYSLHKYITAQRDQVIPKSQIVDSQPPTSMDLAGVVRTELIPYMQQEIATSTGRVANQIFTQMQRLVAPSPAPSITPLPQNISEASTNITQAVRPNAAPTSLKQFAAPNPVTPLPTGGLPPGMPMVNLNDFSPYQQQ